MVDESLGATTKLVKELSHPRAPVKGLWSYVKVAVWLACGPGKYWIWKVRCQEGLEPCIDRMVAT